MVQNLGQKPLETSNMSCTTRYFNASCHTFHESTSMWSVKRPRTASFANWCWCWYHLCCAGAIYFFWECSTICESLASKLWWLLPRRYPCCFGCKNRKRYQFWKSHFCGVYSCDCWTLILEIAQRKSYEWSSGSKISAYACFPCQIPEMHLFVSF